MADMDLARNSSVIVRLPAVMKDEVQANPIMNL